MKPKIFKPLLVVVAGVALLVVLASIGLNLSRAKHEAALAEKKAALEAKGIPVSLVEVNRRYHEHGRGSEENAARFYEQAFGELNADREAVERLSDLFSGWDPFPSFGKEELRFMRTLVERNQRALALLKEAADYPYLRFALDFTEGSELLPPHISGMRTGAQLLRAEAVIAAEEGRIGEATEAVQAVFRMGLHLSEEPTMLAQLSRVLYEQIGISALELVMSRRELASAVLKVFQEQLYVSETAPRMESAMRAELANTEWYFSQIGRFAVFSDDEPAFRERAAFTVYRWPGLLARDERDFLTRMEEMVRLADLPHAERLQVDWEAVEEMPASSLGDILASILIPSMSRVSAADTRSVTHLRAAQIALAAERFRLEHGRFPISPDDFLGAYLDEIPQDPHNVSGEFEWLRTEDAFSIRSQGMMRLPRDQGGKANRIPAADEMTDVVSRNRALVKALRWRR